MFGLFDPVLHNAAGVTSQAQSDVGCGMTGMHGALTQDVELRKASFNHQGWQVCVTTQSHARPFHTNSIFRFCIQNQRQLHCICKDLFMPFYDNRNKSGFNNLVNKEQGLMTAIVSIKSLSQRVEVRDLEG